MQHNVTETVLSSFSRLRRGMRHHSALGFNVLELVDDAADRASERQHDLRVHQLVWSETEPPHPGRLRVRNTGLEDVAVEVGLVLDGGMAMRAVRVSVLIDALAELTVAVEPVASRWWDEGPLRWRGRLEPVATALLLQAALGAEPLASSARTALWSLPSSALMSVEAPSVTDGARGWLLEDDQGFVAGWMADHGSGRRARPHPHSHADLCAPDSAPQQLYLALQEHIECGELDARLLQDDLHGSRELVLLPAGSRLIDRAVGVPSGPL